MTYLGVRNLTEDRTVKSPSWLVFDLTQRYQLPIKLSHGRLEAFLFVQNLFNTQWEGATFAFASRLCPTSRLAEFRTSIWCRAIPVSLWAASHGTSSRPLKTTSNCVLVSKASSTYPTGKELLLQLGVGWVRIPTPPVLSSPAGLLEDRFERSYSEDHMKTKPRILPRIFFNRPTVTVARSLIGKYLVRVIDGRILAGKILEVEAYVGPRDKACHASKGRTQRTEVLFGAPGVAYVYLIYGMYHCLNVVTEREEFSLSRIAQGN